MQVHRLTALTAAALFAAGCGGGKSETKKTCLETGCEGGQVCESAAGGAPACFDPIYVEGRVYDLAVADPATNGLADARVVGQDVNGAPVSSVAISGADGAYQFGVRAARNADGSPAAGTVTLRVDRAGYETFPSGLRTALPIALTSATHGTGRWTVKSGLTDVGLDAIAGAPTGSITGTVQLPASGGALVLADCGGVAYTAVPGSDGTYAIFNVPAGTCDVTAYAKGANYTPVAGATVGTGAVTADLSQSAVPTATVSGQVNFVSKTEWNYTSVLLVVASTFDPLTLRGLTPPGLRAGGVANGGWSISGIPDGHYKALAAFETDYIVRDVSPTGGTAVLEFKVVDGVPLFMDDTSAADIGMFKVTGAVRLTAPIADGTGACSTVTPLPADPGTLPIGGCTTTSTTPTFAWEAYSSTSYYEIKVLSETGATVWTARASASPVVYATPGGTGNVTSATTATTLTAGATYQVRLVAHNVKDEPISMSEDLLGVFTVVAP